MPTQAQLRSYLKPYPKPVQETALWLRQFIWDLLPACNELIYDNYNALVFGFAVGDNASDAFCSIALYSGYANFGFLYAGDLPDPQQLLKGTGKFYRYIRVQNVADFPRAYMEKLLKLAHAAALAKRKLRDEKLKAKAKAPKAMPKGQTISKAVAQVKRRPGKAKAYSKK
jgi:hypothetical protein